MGFLAAAVGPWLVGWLAGWRSLLCKEADLSVEDQSSANWGVRKGVDFNGLLKDAFQFV